MELYINGTGIISAQGNNSNNDFLASAPSYNTDQLLAIEPDYKDVIPPMQLRRMSKVVRMGIGASRICMQQAGLEKPDALSVGTALGCLNDTEQFLVKMIAQDEQMLTPTSFIQSTHNTVAGQIALLSGCHGHNITYVHRGHSFEHAVVNAQLYLNDHPGETILTGGIDELTEITKSLLQAGNVYRKTPATPRDITRSNFLGSIGGEGAAFFLLSGEPAARSHLQIRDTFIFTTSEKKVALSKLNLFLERSGISISEIDLVMLGINGDERNRAFYEALQSRTFNKTSQATFKHLCGEYPTAS
ncbi:MAG TPA: beta-ketoacyl synthase chain length factor, partial [Flavipsychrobacter sp.]|nr:beta-ketoacyl synthase chain length factor [Flavipsychrobacter sp.]